MGSLIEKLQDIFDNRKMLWIVIAELAVIVILMLVMLGVFTDMEIQLCGSAEMTVRSGTVFEDPGACATVNGKEAKIRVSGDLDLGVPGTYTLCYRVRFLLRSKTVYRTVKVIDGTLPIIELTGGDTVIVPYGTEFREPGYKATAADGSALTGKVKVSGTVDSNTVGSYTLKYTVTDQAGHSTEVVRMVQVKPVIYLTFDDGPGQYTQQLLEVLEKYDVKATFFMVNTNYSKKTETMQQIVSAGHAIGIHSMTHQWSIYDTEEAFLADLYGMQKIIYDATGVTTKLMRFPGGSSNSQAPAGMMNALTRKVTALGFTYFDWNVDSNDAGGTNTTGGVYENVINQIDGKTSAVVLQHDIKSYSVEAVEKIIRWGLANGYTFLPLSEDSPVCHHR